MTAIPRSRSSITPAASITVLLSSEPYHFKEGHLAEVAAAVPGAKVPLVDGEMTSWYGSREIDGLRYLAQYASEHSGSRNDSPR